MAYKNEAKTSHLICETINSEQVENLPISKDLAVLINESFLTGTFPAKLKIAKVIPIIKKGLATST